MMVCALATMLFVACGGDDDSDSGSADAGGSDAQALEAAQSGLPFAEPPRMQSSDGVLRFDLVASDRGIDVAGTSVSGRAYDDGLVGPTLVVDPGDTIALTLDNRLDAHTNLHFHGMHVSPRDNGDNIFLSVEPGEQFAYSLAIPQNHPSGTFWYHSHAHGLSEEQVFGGLSGMIIVQGLTELLPAELRGIDDIAIGLKDAQVVGDEIERENIDSNAPTLRVVNSAHLPVQEIAPGEVQLWRLANIGADIWYDVELEGQDLLVIGEDGNPVWEVFSAEHVLLPPGKRFEVLVTGPPEGEYMFKSRKYEQGDDTYPDTDLMTLTSSGAEVPTPAMPTALVPEARIPESEVVERRTMVFDENEDTNQFFINDKEFDPERVDVQPTLGTVEEWTLKNSSGEQHPFHIHVNDFEVISVGGEPYDAHGVQDTVPLDPGKDVVIRTRFTDFTGKFVFHCHILNHEDNGMMAVVEVVE
jgi:FtsP/CotA-like multicopper oxidase with cupredoxin domain